MGRHRLNLLSAMLALALVIATLLPLNASPYGTVLTAGSVGMATTTWGTLSFSSPSNVTVGTAPQGVAIADLDGDGLADVAVANRLSDNITVLKGLGN